MRHFMLALLVICTLPLLAVWCYPLQAFPRWGYMWTIAFSLYTGLKIFTWVWCLGKSNYGVVRNVLYLMVWPGLDAQAFFSDLLPERPPLQEYLYAVIKMTIGLVIFWGIPLLNISDSHYFIAWVGMTGIILFMHCGLIHVISCGLRSSGIQARPIMHDPLWARSIAQFWGDAWNRAFRDVSHRYVFTCSRKYVGAAGALCLVFVVSGLIHELVVTIPAGGGYGGPSIYFLIQGCAVLWSRSPRGKRMGLYQGPLARAFCVLVILLPIQLLFPEIFIENIILPFMEFLGAYHG